MMRANNKLGPDTGSQGITPDDNKQATPGRILEVNGTLRLRANSPQEAKRLLQQKGITLKQFAKMNNLEYRTVSEVVRGVNKGNYGEGHRVAVALGLKEE
jgi:gp16 family phage-associated protein